MHDIPWSCPVCGRSGIFVRTSLWMKGVPESTWETHGGGSAICNKCVKTRKEEIIKHNRIFRKMPGDKKDPNCQHIWEHPYGGRWCCTKCGAEYNWMCGCGGSAYVCAVHYEKFVQAMIDKYGSIENFLAEKSW